MIAVAEPKAWAKTYKTEKKDFDFTPVSPPGKPGQANEYISYNNMFRITASSRKLQLIESSFASLNTVRKAFAAAHPGLFSENPANWAECVELVDRAEKLFKEWRSKQ